MRVIAGEFDSFDRSIPYVNTKYNNVNDKFYSRCGYIEVTKLLFFYNFTEILSPIEYKYTTFIVSGIFFNTGH